MKETLFYLLLHMGSITFDMYFVFSKDVLKQKSIIHVHLEFLKIYKILCITCTYIYITIKILNIFKIFFNGME